MTLFWIIGLVLFGGKIAKASTNRIIGGNIVSIEKYPSIVQVESYNVNADLWLHSCSASIISGRYVLSAAQCFSGRNSDVSFWRIRAGASIRQHDGIIFYVDKIVNHPNYWSRTNHNDISVVKLTGVLPSLPTIQQAVLVAQGSRVNDNLSVELAGWGYMFPDGPSSTVLRDVTVYTINNKLCADRFAEISINVTEHMICSGILDVGGRDSCSFDVGGPMFYRGILIGVISNGYGCADGNWPRISTAVASYTNWIRATAR